MAVGLLAAIWFAAAPAHAQSPTVPSTLDPGRLQENIGRAPELRPAPEPMAPLTIDQRAPEAAAGMRFHWREIRIVGAAALPVERLMQEWRHAPGAEVSVEDVFRFANALTRLYAREGYALSFAVVPEQRIDDGIVTVRIVEGFIEAINFTGDPAPKGLSGDGPVAAMIARIRQSRPLRTADLERYLLLINDIPGMQVRAIISPSPTIVGGSILTLDLTRQRASVEAGYNNFMPASLDTHVMGGAITANGIVSGADSIRIDGWKSALSNAYWSLGGDYSTFVGTDGLTVTVSGFYSESRPITTLLRALEYQGVSMSARIAARYPLIRSRTRNLGFEWVTSLMNTDSELVGQSEMLDRIRSTALALNFSFSGAGQSTTVIRAGAEHGLAVLNARGNSRANGVPDYLVLTLDAQRLQPLGIAAGGQISVVASAQGQVAADGALFSAAECSYGGRRFGRRFDAGELTGDHCLLGSMELRWSKPIQLGPGNPGGLQLYGFVDGGTLWQKGVLVEGERRKRSAMSGGGGVRLEAGRHFSAGFEVSRALHAPTGSPLAREVRAMGNISLRF